MGIVNRTPDSFFDGGTYLDDDAAHARLAELVRDGADILDVGAESSRPGALAVDASTQIERLGDMIAYAVSLGVAASADTTLPEVAEHALGQGATMINSISLEPAAELGELCARHDAYLVLTHCRGSMAAMEGFSRYDDSAYADVVDDVIAEWRVAAGQALRVGLAPDRLVFDPGLGFTKSAARSLELCARLTELKQRTAPHLLLVGPSRKSYIGVTAAGVSQGEVAAPAGRLGGSIAAVLDCAARGADIVRVHDVAETAQALDYQTAVDGLLSASPRPSAVRGGVGA